MLAGTHGLVEWNQMVLEVKLQLLGRMPKAKTSKCVMPTWLSTCSLKVELTDPCEM